MKTVTGTSIFPYRAELILEVTGYDADGDIVVRTYQFEYDETDPQRVRPKQEIPNNHASLVEGVLEEHSYTLR